MFASANKILTQLYLYEKGELPEITGLKVDFGELGLYYDPAHGKNWWEYYFEPIQLGSKEDAKIKHLSRDEALSGCRMRYKMAQNEIISLVIKYFHPLPYILDKVHQFAKNYFEGFFMIGVHFRGTDKYTEARRVNYEEIFIKINECIPADSPYKIFVATDEIGFLQAIKREFPNQVIATNAYRSEGDIGTHFSTNHPFETGEEALIDALLLSRCDLLIRTSSNLSLWSTYFNPNISVFLLNQRYKETLNPE